MDIQEIFKKISITLALFLVIEIIFFYFSENYDLLRYLYLFLLFLFPMIYSLFVSIKYFEKKEVLLKTPILSMVLFLISSCLIYFIYFIVGIGPADALSLVGIMFGIPLLILTLILVSLAIGLIILLLSLIIYFKK